MRKSLIVLIVVCGLLLAPTLMFIGLSLTACPPVTSEGVTLTPALHFYSVSDRSGALVSEAGDDHADLSPAVFSGRANQLSLLFSSCDFGGKDPHAVTVIVHTAEGNTTYSSLSDLSFVSREGVDYAFLQVEWQRPFSTFSNAVYYFQ